MIKVQELEKLDPTKGIFMQDLLHMTTPLGTNVLVLHENHPDEEANYLLIYNPQTGERYKIVFNEKGKKTHALAPKEEVVSEVSVSEPPPKPVVGTAKNF